MESLDHVALGCVRVGDRRIDAQQDVQFFENFAEVEIKTSVGQYYFGHAVVLTPLQQAVGTRFGL